MSNWIRSAVGVAFVSALAGTARAQQTDRPAPTDQPVSAAPEPSPDLPLLSFRPKWDVEVNARAWWVSPSGKVRLPGSAAGGNGDHIRVDDLNLDTPRFGPLAEVQIAADPWRFSFSGGEFSLDRNQTTADRFFTLGDVAVAPGDSLATKLDFYTFQATAGYRLWIYDFKAHSVRPEEAIDSVIQTFVLGGVRLYDFDIEMRLNSPPAGGPSVAQSEQLFVEPIGGLRFEAEFTRHFEIDLEVTAGGMADSDRSSFSIDVAVAFAWRPCDAVGLEIGWRQLAYRLNDGQAPMEFAYNGRMAGVFAGLTIRF